MADILLSSALSGSSPRRQIITLTASNAALPVPSWAQGGKGIVYVSGCGGGGGGSGGRAGSAAFAIKHPIVIPAGLATLSAVVGAAGAQSADVNTLAGAAGGATSVSLAGTTALLLRGGGGGGSVENGSSAGSGGAPEVWGESLLLANGASTSGATSESVRSIVLEAMRFSALYSTVSRGASGWQSSNNVFPSNPNSNRAGFNLFGSQIGGFGGGGASSAGRPGFLMLEFVEGL